jgi:polysaccharide deacetylase family protein (PEP-CTERM system associated)
MINALTIDLEDYYYIIYRNFFAKRVEVSGRALESARIMLDFLKSKNASATFFTLGALAQKFPGLVKEISAAGCEVASHGMEHIYWGVNSVPEMRQDLDAAKKLLEDLTGKKVSGYRAPAFSLSLSRPQEFEVLAELGYEYDSSIFPFKARRYGSPESPLAPYLIKTTKGNIMEFPLCVTEFVRRFPAAGGGYMRFFPLAYNKWAIRRNNQKGIMATAYFHPYETETDPLPFDFTGATSGKILKFKISHFLQCWDRKNTLKKLDALLNSFQFDSFQNILAQPQFAAQKLPAFPG